LQSSGPFLQLLFFVFLLSNVFYKPSSCNDQAELVGLVSYTKSVTTCLS
jgi:hypothetical protein